MTKTAVNPFLIAVCLIFAFGVLGVSLLSASRANSSLRDLTSARRLRLSTKILPGSILYPFVVVRDKLALVLMTTADQCQERLELARERLSQSRNLLDLGETQLALETAIKGQHYLADAADQCNKEALPDQYRENVRVVIEEYDRRLSDMKQYYPDTDRAVIDQLLAANSALLTKMGNQ
jgi:hypothetical protein